MGCDFAELHEWNDWQSKRRRLASQVSFNDCLVYRAVHDRTEVHDSLCYSIERWDLRKGSAKVVRQDHDCDLSSVEHNIFKLAHLHRNGK